MSFWRRCVLLVFMFILAVLWVSMGLWYPGGCIEIVVVCSSGGLWFGLSVVVLLR